MAPMTEYIKLQLTSAHIQTYIFLPCIPTKKHCRYTKSVGMLFSFFPILYAMDPIVNRRLEKTTDLGSKARPEYAPARKRKGRLKGQTWKPTKTTPDIKGQRRAQL